MMREAIEKIPPKHYHPRLDFFVLIFIGILIFLFFLYVDPEWQTNDDVAMAMVAHGYGISTFPSPYLYFSTVSWGEFVGLIHNATPFQGYSLGIIIAITLAFCAMYAALREYASLPAALLTSIAVFITPVLVPQFTSTSGMLAVASALCARAYAQRGAKWLLLVGSIAAVGAFAIRPLEFCLVAIVALPILPWRLVGDRTTRQAAAVVACAILAVLAVEAFAYRTQAWRDFNEVNISRAPFTDFGAAELVKREPEVLSSFGYSNNDIDLISQWFFADKSIYNAELLSGILVSSGYNFMLANLKAIDIRNGFNSFSIFESPLLLLFVLSSILFYIKERSFGIILCGMMGVFLIFAFGFAGAPVRDRVFYAPLSLIFVAGTSVLAGRGHTGRFGRSKNWIAILVALVATVAAAHHAIGLFEKRPAGAIHEDMRALGTPIFVWGGGLPYSAAYSFAYSPDQDPLPSIYGLGVLSYAPFGVPNFEDGQGRRLVTRLLSGDVQLVTEESNLKLLAIYCAEHHDRVFAGFRNQSIRSFAVWTVSCRSPRRSPTSSLNSHGARDFSFSQQ